MFFMTFLTTHFLQMSDEIKFGLTKKKVYIYFHFPTETKTSF